MATCLQHKTHKTPSMKKMESKKQLEMGHGIAPTGCLAHFGPKVKTSKTQAALFGTASPKGAKPYNPEIQYTPMQFIWLLLSVLLEDELLEKGAG